MKFLSALFLALIVTIGVYAQTLSVAIGSQTNVLVNGQNTGAVTLTGNGGTKPYLYSRDGVNYQISATFGSLAAGNYTFYIKDAASSTASVSTVISQLSPLAIYVVSQNNVAVIGQNTGAVTLAAAGGKLPYQYTKDGINFQSSSTFSSLAAGNYTFTVKDSLLSTATVSVTITQSNILNVAVTSQINVSVIGQSTGSVTLAGAGGTAPYVFSKNGGAYQTSGIFNALAAGNYIFTIRDAAFNTSAISVTIAQPAPLAAAVGSKTNVSINGQPGGSVTIAASGGTSPYQYSKDGTTFQSSGTFSNLNAGAYTFTVRDATNATATVLTTITQPELLIAKLESKTDVDTYGKQTGLITISATGGIAPYQYSKDGATYQVTPSFNELAAGKYNLTVKDAAGATSKIEVEITEPAFKIENIKAMNNFSPNGDGLNDKWTIEGVLDFPEHTLSIFDRGGRVVYKVKNYKNDWDGTVNGANLAEGTYYYALNFETPGIGTKKGFITLVK